MKSAAFAALLAGATACAGAPRARPETTAPRDLAIEWDANGLLWDKALYASDSTNDRVLRWDEASGWTVVAALPPGGRPGLGQPAPLPDGGLLVPRFGHGESGGLAVISADGRVTALPGLAPTRKRLGTAAAPDGRVFITYFGKREEPGAIAALTPGGAEVDLVTGLGKPIGVVLRGDWLYFSDQGKDELRRCRLPACAAPELVAHVAEPDYFAADAAGRLYVGTRDGSIVRIAEGGRSDVVAAGLGRVWGVAVDPVAGRLFVAAKSAGRSFIRVMALPR